MPREILDIKKFLQIIKGVGADQKTQKTESQKKVLYIKHGKSITKFKLRGRRYLYTFQTPDKDKANKFLQSIPATLQKVDLKSKTAKKGKK